MIIDLHTNTQGNPEPVSGIYHFSMETGDSLVFCANSPSAYITTTAEILIERSPMPCKIQVKQDCGAYEWVENPNHIWTACGTTDVETPLGLDGQKAFRITANADTVVTVASSQNEVSGCFGMATTCDQCVVDAVDASTAVLEEILLELQNTVQKQVDFEYAVGFDENNNEIVREVTYAYDSTGAVLAGYPIIEYRDLLTGAVVPTPASFTPNLDYEYETVQLPCKRAINTGTGYAIGDEIVSYLTTIRKNGVFISNSVTYYNSTQNAPISAPLPGDLEPCATKQTQVVQAFLIDSDKSCPFYTDFIRHFSYENGVVASFYDTDVDGITPYTVIGTIVKTKKRLRVGQETLTVSAGIWTQITPPPCANVAETQLHGGVNDRLMFSKDGGTTFQYTNNYTEGEGEQENNSLWLSTNSSIPLEVHIFYEFNPNEGNL